MNKTWRYTKTRWLLLIALSLLCWTCVTIRLENRLRKLNPVIAQWYEIHRILMETKIPKWLDERGGREKIHFLRLPQKLQVIYITVFWKMRAEGLRNEYYTRIAVANRSFSGEGKPGWETDRGRVLLLCGFPWGIIHYPLFPQNDARHNIEGHCYEVWQYYQRGHLVQYAFKYHAPNTWRREFSFNTGGQNIFEERCQKLFAPTEEGWDLWGNILLQWVKAIEEK